MFRLPTHEIPVHLRQFFTPVKDRTKSLMLLPQRYAIGCIDQLNLTTQAGVVPVPEVCW